MLNTNPSLYFLALSFAGAAVACDTPTDEPVATLVAPAACRTHDTCGADGYCGFAEGWDMPSCVDGSSNAFPGCEAHEDEPEQSGEVAVVVAPVASGSSTLKDTCYCSAGTYRVRWCYSALRQYWYTNGFC